MGAIPDYYNIIQVAPQADKEVIEAAYRRLAAKYHPDVDHTPGATERMKLLNAAYEVLSDPVKRRTYDLQRAAALPGPGGSRPRGVPRPDVNEWIATAGWTLATLVISAAVSRFGVRGLVLAGLVVLAFWLVSSSKKS